LFVATNAAELLESNRLPGRRLLVGQLFGVSMDHHRHVFQSTCRDRNAPEFVLGVKTVGFGLQTLKVF
jgi:hypothetical protein